jgi:WD repeat-containing protein 35
VHSSAAQIITLNSVSIIVAEFIPFGANQIVQMNQNLGSTERVQGGFFTALIDSESSGKPDTLRHTLYASRASSMGVVGAAGTKFEVTPGLTSISILDYTLTKHVNFEADIHLPEEEGVVQVETFGVSMNADGTVFYGMQVG